MEFSSIDHKEDPKTSAAAPQADVAKKPETSNATAPAEQKPEMVPKLDLMKALTEVNNLFRLKQKLRKTKSSL